MLVVTVHVLYYPCLLSCPFSWYYGDVSRAEAEKCLAMPSNNVGTFLIRVSSSQRDMLSLSLRDIDGVKHYRIRKLDTGQGFFIAARAVFNTLHVSCWICVCVHKQFSFIINRNWWIIIALMVMVSPND